MATTKKQTYQEALTEIDDILRKIESNTLDIDDLAEKVKRVAFLLKFCKEKLQRTNEEVEKILNDMDPS